MLEICRSDGVQRVNVAQFCLNKFYDNARMPAIQAPMPKITANSIIVSPPQLLYGRT